MEALSVCLSGSFKRYACCTRLTWQRINDILKANMGAVCAEGWMNDMRIKNILFVSALCLGLLCGCGSEAEEAPAASVPAEESPAVESTVPEEEKLPGLTIISETVDGESVVLETSYCTVKYPFAFSDVVKAEAIMDEDCAALRFNALLGDKALPAFDLEFFGGSGTELGTMETEGGTAPVSVSFHDPEGLGEGEESTFYAVQEIFNDVLQSLAESGVLAE